MDWLLYFAVVMLLPAVLSYLCGCINGAILISKHYLHEDVRTRGSGNAGLTNFYRNYGAKYAALVLALDALKMVMAIIITCTLMGWTPEAKLWGGLFCALGHIFPVTFRFKGGKGILSGVTLLLMLDLRIGLVCLVVFVILVAATRYISLGSIVGSALAPALFLVLYWGHWFAFGLILLTAGLLIWSHRGNIKRLIAGNESKFSFQ
ncbi:MAG: glycerol-3-phosphate 1-O-acyltransferase PlsY [Oscillospiraceae bacterium]|nr:glycerol-3-phosphate 1-O-acyltransferase PlsY [Oscillospiraceae bacterium]